MDYHELIQDLRYCASSEVACDNCKHKAESWCTEDLIRQAADVIEELLKAAKSMHTWIFLNTADEQEAYQECHLSDEMNRALGYGGKMEIVR